MVIEDEGQTQNKGKGIIGVNGEKESEKECEEECKRERE